MNTLIHLLKYLFIGAWLGLVLIKSEAASWFRIQEMFHFQSFHMFGIIGSAVTVGIISVFLLRRFQVTSLSGEQINPQPKPFQKVGNLLGGLMFGVGWALTGACPGPMFALAGGGWQPMLLAIGSALAGVWVYAHVRPHLPH